MIGVNTFGLIRKMQEDMPGTFNAIAKAGFDEVELLVIPKKKQGKLPLAIASEESVSVLIDEAKKNGLRVRSAHVFGDFLCFLMPRKRLAAYLEKLHRTYGIHTFVFSGMFRDVKGAKKWARFLRELSETMTTDGCRILYHNHSQEFEMIQVDGKPMTALDYFFSLAGEKVGMQLDIGWAGIGGDEIEIVRKYASRIVSLHLKDFLPGTKGQFNNQNMPKERFCTIGDGEIRTAEILAMRNLFPEFNGSIVIDQDHSSTDILEDIQKGYQNIAAML